MGTFLRLVGGLGFLGTLFLPTVHGCGTDYSQVQIARAYPSTGGVAVLLVAVGFGLLAFLGPFLAQRPTRTSEGFVMLVALAFAVAAVAFSDQVIGKGGSMLLPIGWQVGALG